MSISSQKIWKFPVIISLSTFCHFSLYLFELPIESGVVLDFGGTTIEIDECMSLVIDGAIEDCDLREYDLAKMNFWKLQF